MKPRVIVKLARGLSIDSTLDVIAAIERAYRVDVSWRFSRDHKWIVLEEVLPR